LHINSLGFRGEEIKTKKQPGTYRIVVLGGSTVLNREVPFESNAVRLLEKKLRQHYPDKKIQVINAGKDFYTSEHSLIQYMFKIQDMDPDLIIMWHGVNDMLESCMREGVITHGNYQSDYSHNFGIISNIVFTYFKPQPLFQIKLLTIDFADNFFRDNLYSDVTIPFKKKIKKEYVKAYLRGENTIEVHDYPSIDAYKRNLSYLMVLANNRNIPIILGNQPSLFKKNNTAEEVEKIVFPQPLCIKDNKAYSIDSLRYGLDLFNAQTKKTASENNITFVDLDKTVPKNLDNFVDSIHYTKEGNSRIAESLYQMIVSKGFIQNN
jgi:hypothetical protein